MEYKIQHAQKCLYCGKYLLCNEQVGTYTYEDMKDWLGHVECANLHLIKQLEERVENIITKEHCLSSTGIIEIIELDMNDVNDVNNLVPAIQPTYIMEYDKPNTVMESNTVDLTNDEMDVL